MEKIVSLAKRRGFVFQSSEIYGGLNGCYDYGPLGVELFNNIKNHWWRTMTLREDIEGLDASILMHPRVWEASGHVEHFTDPMVDCKQCRSRYRTDELPESGACPNCGGKDTFTEARKFNLMFRTFVGPVEDSSAVVFLRPETAQGIYVNFFNVQSAARQKIPFGIAQVGKAFRNEINTKNFLFRTREFEQMEMQFFVKPGEDDKWFEYWKEQRIQWFKDLGMTPEKLRFNEHGPDELAHYAKTAFDIQYEFPFGWGEIEGIHNRTDFDLKQHEQFSGKAMKYFDQEANEKYIPYVVETSAGASRSFMAFLVDAFAEEQLEKETRTVMRFHPHIAPINAAVFPLVNRDGMPEKARAIMHDLQRRYRVFYDDKGAVGRRYRRQDEAGTPFCITIDSQTLEDQTVTIRDRDSMEQVRVADTKIAGYLAEKLGM